MRVGGTLGLRRLKPGIFDHRRPLAAAVAVVSGELELGAEMRGVAPAVSCAGAKTNWRCCNEGRQILVLMVGRIVTRLKRQGVLIERQASKNLDAQALSAGSLRGAKPKDYVPRLPGSLVEADTLDVRPLPGVVLKCPARDVISRWACSRSIAKPPQQRCRFPTRGLRPFVLPPRSPTLNGAVKRAWRIHTEEFYEVR
jgi:hypothetical protein